MTKKPPLPRDRGSALLVVLATMTIVAVFASVALTASIRTLQQGDRSEDWNQALSAAEAGVADYLARLNRDDLYWQTVDCDNVALRGPLSGSSPPCGWDASTEEGWLRVPGSPRATFHYDVDVTTTRTTGAVVLTSTGKVGELTRTVQVRLRRGGFGEFLYYTQYETLDTTGMSEGDAARCTRYAWPTLPSSQRRDSGCQIIRFITDDEIDGPVHSNDAIVMDGSPRFQGITTTSLPSCRSSEGTRPPVTSCYVPYGSSASPVFERGIGYRPEVKLPESIGDLRQHVTPSATSNPGCLYTGPTRIKLLPTTAGNVQQMQVWSMQSGQTWGPPLNPGCGTARDLQSAGGATVTVPQDNLVLVQNVPSLPSSTPSRPTSGGCKTTGGIGDGLPRADRSGSFPDYDVNLDLPESNCLYGNLYLEGQLRGRLTIAADNNIIVTGDITYGGGENGTDALGLVASNSVKVYHPVKCSGRSLFGGCNAWRNLGGTLTNVTINAAILTLQHSFAVQSYERGEMLGKLRVFGSISQRFRGPVGTGTRSSGTGYAKDYVYDTFLRYAPPPYFLDPVNSSWGQKTFAELTPLYR